VLLKEVAPRVARVALVFNPSTASIGGSYFSGSIKAAAASFAVEAVSAPVHHESELNSVFATQAREPNGGVIVLPDIFTTLHRAELVSLAARHRIPTVYPSLAVLVLVDHNRDSNFQSELRQ
jgi:hypothetical protein